MRGRARGPSMRRTDDPALCEIARLPEELLSAALSLTTPRDACRAAAVSRAFHAAADADDVWSRFLPRDFPPLAEGETGGPEPSSKKETFLRLSDRPALLADDLTSMQLDKKTGARCYMLCYMLSARALGIFGPKWRRIPLTTSSRFSECAELHRPAPLVIDAKISCRMLSLNLTYGGYLVFKVTDYPRFRPLNASVIVGGSPFMHARSRSVPPSIASASIDWDMPSSHPSTRKA